MKTLALFLLLTSMAFAAGEKIVFMRIAPGKDYLRQLVLIEAEPGQIRVVLGPQKVVQVSKYSYDDYLVLKSLARDYVQEILKKDVPSKLARGPGAFGIVMNLDGDHISADSYEVPKSIERLFVAMGKIGGAELASEMRYIHSNPDKAFEELQPK